MSSHLDRWTEGTGRQAKNRSDIEEGVHKLVKAKLLKTKESSRRGVDLEIGEMWQTAAGDCAKIAAAIGSALAAGAGISYAKKILASVEAERPAASARVQPRPFAMWVGDWRKDPGVQSLDYFDRGVWMEMLFIMHESKPRGTLSVNGEPMSNRSLARALGLTAQRTKAAMSRILAAGVASLDPATGVLYCRRMVRENGGWVIFERMNSVQSPTLSSETSMDKGNPTPFPQDRKAVAGSFSSSSLGGAEGLPSSSLSSDPGEKPPKNRTEITRDQLPGMVIGAYEDNRGRMPPLGPFGKSPPCREMAERIAEDFLGMFDGDAGLALAKWTEVVRHAGAQCHPDHVAKFIKFSWLAKSTMNCLDVLDGKFNRPFGSDKHGPDQAKNRGNLADHKAPSGGAAERLRRLRGNNDGVTVAVLPDVP